MENAFFDAGGPEAATADGLTYRTLYDLLFCCWRRETCAPRMQSRWSPDNPTLGQCSVTAFLAQDLLGGEVLGLPLGDGNYHCFNRVNGHLFDLTSEQFGDRQMDYSDPAAFVPQERAAHFQKAEKYERYLLLRRLLLEKYAAWRACPVSLRRMTRPLCHALFRDWQNDAAMYADPAECRPYVYDAAAVDRYFDAKRQPSRVMLAVMRDGRPIGEVQLKRIDPAEKTCELSIHLQNDSVKGQGCGTAAERLAVAYAFGVLALRAVRADAVCRNTRSRHVLEKVGFHFLREENGFCCYEIER